MARRRVFGTLSLVLVGVAAAAVAYLGLTLPPRRVVLHGDVPPTVVFGAYHVHSTRSDGAGTPDDIAAAAARAGLAFVILTDHGDATRAPDPPAYRHGVLCLDAVEISTAAGHLVALNLRAPAPYPLAGEGRDVLEDVHRLGGWGIVAHPDSPKTELAWRSWDVPYDGIEWLNADSEWRDAPAHVPGAALRALVRPPETIASLFARPARTIARWDRAAGERPVFALAAVDAHGQARRHPGLPALLAGPSDEDMFQTLAQGVMLARPWSGNAAMDAGQLLGAMRGGGTFSLVRAIAAPAVLDFTAAQGDVRVGMGGRLDQLDIQTTFRATVPGAPAARVVLLHDGVAVGEGQGTVALTARLLPGTYRVEAYYPGASVPWIFSNAIYAGPVAEPPQPAPAPVRARVALPDTDWAIERSPSATGSFVMEPDGEGTTLRFSFGLGGGHPAGQYAALASTAAVPDHVDRVQMIGRADRPMRLSVQLRQPGGRDGQRWRRSVYLDQRPRAIMIPLDEFEPVGATTTPRPDAALIGALLFVVDTVNTAPGTPGTIWLSRVAWGTGGSGGAAIRF